jgi:hypothetical protein
LGDEENLSRARETLLLNHGGKDAEQMQIEGMRNIHA